MSKKMEIKLNSSGIRGLLRSNEMMETIQPAADRVLRKCGTGYQLDPYTGKGRVNIGVRAVSDDAVKDNFENNTLLKALK